MARDAFPTVEAAARRAVRGAVAGGLGTLALNATTYLDVAVRGRPPSAVPERVVAKMTEARGLSLSSAGQDSPAARHRRTGLAALGGYATGVVSGASFGVARPYLRALPRPVGGVLLGAAVMVATDTSATLSGATDPRRWTFPDWLADVVPHVVFGLATASAFDRLGPRRQPPRPPGRRRPALG